MIDNERTFIFDIDYLKSELQFNEGSIEFLFIWIQCALKIENYIEQFHANLSIEAVKYLGDCAQTIGIR